MAIGDDLKAVFKEVGVGYTIVRTPTSITGEYLDYSSNKQASKPFTIEHELQVELPYDTKAVPGDLLLFTNDGRKYYVMHMVNELFENSPVTISAVLYRANNTISTFRNTKTGTFDKTSNWVSVLSTIPCVLESSEYGARSDETPKPVVRPDRSTIVAYVPKTLDVKKGDRVQIDGYTRGWGPSGVMNLVVDDFDDFTYRGMSIIFMREDPRK